MYSPDTGSRQHREALATRENVDKKATGVTERAVMSPGVSAETSLKGSLARLEAQRMVAEIKSGLGIGGQEFNLPAFDTAQKIIQEAGQIQIKPEDRNKKGELLVFPGGPVSGLPEHLWKVAKTEAFKEWFGDWENRPVENFTTGRGSVYTYDNEGKTTRFKTATSEQHARQDIMVFVNLNVQEEQDYVDAYRNSTGKVYVVEKMTDNSPKIIRDVSEVSDKNNLYLAIMVDGKITKLKKASNKPVEGYNTFDARWYQDKKGQTMADRHLGNKVKKINYKDNPSLSRVLGANSEPLALKNPDGTHSLVKVLNPLNFTRDELSKWKTSHGLDGKEWASSMIKELNAKKHDGLLVDGKPIKDKTGDKPIVVNSDQIINI